ncbi:unnamed protein product [Paramecium primaurelia]|uniref:Uncharacterized protein n=1 Tax=Paramecium primaurelia TaxID=5886 RepID=A0A8S1JW27_PARPR|nr:unnamed protein product [Paramecium primaurelia]
MENLRESPIDTQQGYLKIIAQCQNLVECWKQRIRKTNSKLQLLERAFEFIPNSGDFCKELVSLSSEQEAIIIHLCKAVQYILKNFIILVDISQIKPLKMKKPFQIEQGKISSSDKSMSLIISIFLINYEQNQQFNDFTQCQYMKMNNIKSLK